MDNNDIDSEIQHIFDNSNDIKDAIKKVKTLLVINEYAYIGHSYSDGKIVLRFQQKFSTGLEKKDNTHIYKFNNKVNSNIDNEGIFNERGFDKNGIHKDTKTKYDNDGFDKSGYDKDYNARDEVKKLRTIPASTFVNSNNKTKRNSGPKIKLGIFDRFKKKSIDDRVVDEILYEYVFSELEQDIRAKGLWAKAYANSDGNENKIEPLYMQYRVQAIKDAFVAMEIAYNDMSKQMLLEYIKNKITP